MQDSHKDSSLCRTLLDHLPQRISYKDEELRYVFCNEPYAAELGISPHEIAGKTDFDLFPREIAEKYRRDDEAVIGRGQTAVYEENYMLRGRIVATETTKTPVRNEKGEVTGILTVFWDISARKESEKELQDNRRRLERLVEERTRELERSNRELEHFAYLSSHDLQEPLRSISGFLGLLERNYAPELDEKAREYVDRAAKGAARMSAMIQDLLEYCRVSTQGKSFVPTDLNAAVRSALDHLHGSIEASGALLEIAPLPGVNADAAQMSRLFLNLIGNGIKYAKEGVRPEIRIRAEKAKGYWGFFVEDNGIGIEREYQHRIFGIFQRLHPREAYEGTGIGLAVCKRIVERHGGRIWVESTPGQGSSFRFTLPEGTAE